MHAAVAAGILRLCASVAGLSLLLAIPAAAQIVTVQGDHFVANGEPKFLLFVSYFDAMRRANADSGNGDLDTDFAYFHKHGFDGIRVFPNWWYPDPTNTCPGPVDDAQKLFTASGAINDASNMWPVFLKVLDRATANNLIVDVTFTRETYGRNGHPEDWIPVTAYQNAIATVAQRLSGTYRNVVFDVQNEYDYANKLSDSQVAGILAAIHAADPLRIATGSGSGGGITGAINNPSGANIVAYHDHRYLDDPDYPDWYTSAAATANFSSIRASVGVKPAYLQEPMPFRSFAPCSQTHDSEPTHARQAAANAKRSGYAAWTFHTRQSFSLSDGSLLKQLQDDAAQKAELEAIKGAVDKARWGAVAPMTYGTPMDVDHDGKADCTVWRPANGTWYVHTSSTNSDFGYRWGEQPLGDIPQPGDYDGDGRPDLAVWRKSTGEWFVNLAGPRSTYTTFMNAVAWGDEKLGDRPVAADYDGDGKTDFAVWRATDSTWYVLLSSSNYTTVLTKYWGSSALGDVPVPADYDGDGKADFAVWRPGTGEWWILNSHDNYTSSSEITWGGAAYGDLPVPGDFDGDGKADPAIWRTTTGYWWVTMSGSNYASYLSRAWGDFATFHDVPVVADMDGDHKADMVVWRPSTGAWWVLPSTANWSGGASFLWGADSLGDTPIAGGSLRP